jgi:hypothetical protein
VIVHHFGRTRERGLVPLDRAITVPPLYAIGPRAGRLARAAPVRRQRPSERSSRALRPQRLDWAPGDATTPERLDRRAGRTSRLVEPLTDGRLVVTGHPQSLDTTEGSRRRRARERAGVGARRPSRPRERHGGRRDVRRAGRRRPGGAAPVGRIEVSYPLGADLGLVGLRGATTSAVAAAAQQREALLQTKDRLAHAAVAGPPLDPTLHVPHHRAILAPGRLYRLDVDMSWSGTLYGQDASGTRVQREATSGPMRTYARGAATDAPTLRQLFFATTPRRTVTDPIPPRPGPFGPHSPIVVLSIRRRQSRRSACPTRSTCRCSSATSRATSRRSPSRAASRRPLRAHFVRITSPPSPTRTAST